ncbi:fungal-specific transcription factor domain-containing protein [Mycena sp. CBHHK59/15]|nr:fungal-specific transcription factor domain-containing protein [Mycena sp. CBHHK59/15]
MAYRSPNSSSGSQSPTPSSACSSNVSPASINVPLIPMMSTPDGGENRSARASPNRYPVDLVRSQSASKGGCWTCRLRRKKCDEEREGDSCRTCIRLTIDCLGWGPKRPEWMRDKMAVEAYKADIKAQLTRAGSSAGSRARRCSARCPARARCTTAFDATMNYGAYYGQRHSMYPGMPGASNSAFHQLPAASWSDPTINTPVDFNSSIFQYDSPQSSTPGSSLIPPLDFDFAQLGNNGGFDFEVRAPSPEQVFPLFSGQNSLQENHVIYYFEHVRKVQYIFAGNTVTNITCSMIVQEPRGAVTNAVCALASLHYTRMRVAHGLEAPDPNPEHSTAKYFHDEAYFQLANAKQMHGSYSESDAIAALHLVWFSQLSGGTTDWQTVFAMACDWLAQQRGLLTDDNPKLALQNLSATGQLIVKLTLWLDIFSSLTVMRPPKYLALYKRLFGDLAGWSNDVRMDSLTGCPDEVLLGIAEVSALSHWKAAEKHKGTLSYPDLIRRGGEIEQRLRKSGASSLRGEADTTPLHPTLLQAESDAAADAVPFPSDETRQLVAKIFSETVLLYLHTVLSDSNPGVPEISNSVGVIVQYLGQLPSSEVDRALVFPICLAGCMTDDSSWRDFLKGRIQSLDESIGNLLRTRLLMEAVWQKRDISGHTVDWRETMRERGLNLLLV